MNRRERIAASIAKAMGKTAPEYKGIEGMPLVEARHELEGTEVIIKKDPHSPAAVTAVAAALTETAKTLPLEPEAKGTPIK